MSGAAAAQVFTQNRMRRVVGLMERMFIDDAIKLVFIIKDPYEPTSDYTSCYFTLDKRACVWGFAFLVSASPTRGTARSHVGKEPQALFLPSSFPATTTATISTPSTT